MTVSRRVLKSKDNPDGWTPSLEGDDLCFNCNKPGSTCPDCGQVLCAECMKNPYQVEPGHLPADHLVAPSEPSETELQKLSRENRELIALVHGDEVAQLQRKNALLRDALAKKGSPK